MKTSDQINEIAKAMSLAQQQMRPALKDSVNPHFKSKYSDISSVWDAIREPITSNGLTIIQDITTEEKKVSVTTRIIHTSGQWFEFGPLCVPMSKLDAHGVGSAISYGKRYALCAAVGVVSSDEDDDGNHAQGKHTIPKNPEYDSFLSQNPEKHQYIKLICKTSGKSEYEVLGQALANIDRFNEAFDRWKAQQTHVDETI